MNTKVSTQDLTKIRYKNRAKDKEWILKFLHSAPFGSLATSNDGQPFIVTRNFAFDEKNKVIYMHGATKGRTFENVQTDERICFSVSEMGRLLPADKAVEFGVEYRGVVLFGKATIVKDKSEAKFGLQLLLDKYFPHLHPGADYEPIIAEALKVTAVYRIEIESWSGKEKTVPDDYPGAFWYGGH